MKPRIVREELVRAKAKYLLKECRISRPPVPLEKIADELNIKIHYHLVPDVDFSFSLKHKNRYFISIAISGNQYRDRWSLGHEIGHIVLGHYELYDVDTLIEGRLTERERYILDREADIFTEELLMPYEWMSRIRLPADVDELKTVFRVSREAMCIRVDNFAYYSEVD